MRRPAVEQVRVPALVAPGAPLTPEARQRYARHLLLPGIGETGQRRLANAHVAVVGAGGLGSPALLYLAAAGVGRLTIIDDDTVDVTNLHRQVIHPDASVGRPKVASAAEAVRSLNPTVVVVIRGVRLVPGNAADLLAGADLVLDGTDNFETRYAVNDACAALGLPCVWASVHRTQAQVAVFWAAPPSGVPGVDLRDLFPHPPAPGSVPTCGDAGVLGALTGQVGSMMAAEAIKLICGVGEPLLGRVVFLDLLDATLTHIPLRPGAHPTAPNPPTAPSPQEDPLFASVTPTQLAAELAADHPPVVVDVREPSELAFGAIAGSMHLPLQQFLDDVPAFDPDADVVIHCRLGPRAERAAAALAASGHTKIRLLEGGILAWGRDVDPTVTPY